ncbi:leucine-rich repeat, immunoglobulin-like domain and transmembrane domain-containing protein 2 [Pangasianodon hypophthalmus]|uniref:leucine-rich repeat, immunoglobulin-like domain and transmembrane domain-containing protein 2 n=1 Tax=Pangasianodon hypophthalmus TaxID=310915 RepID=UPI0023072B83|nr:leucine-rich repeat, immunoglobulin-like domain and transmembrane domain-containing protein 2 [Pangasianodon hypophthalmus]
MFSITLTALLLFTHLYSAVGFCVTGCSCTEDSAGRSLLCMETALGSIPENLPGDFIKIRIENSHLTEIPQRAFYTVSSLESLWLNFNTITLMDIKSLEGLYNLTELRLEGNKLRTIPWMAFQETPKLKILDLKHNRLDVLPEFALRHLPTLTYLDLSFNQLTVISPDVFLNWPRYQVQKHSRMKESEANVVLALHNNLWLCDCRLKGFVDFVKSISPPIILMNSYLSCSGPKSKAGKFFHEVELRNCLKPESSTPDANVTAALGSNTTLRCFVKARPDAVVRWSYSLKAIRGFTVSQSQVNEDTIISSLIIPSVRLSDHGLYRCSASNFIGNSSVSIQLNILFSNASFAKSPSFPLPSVNENIYIDIRIAKQTVYGITIEWYAATENPSETWFTVHFGRYDSPKKEALYIGPGINKYSVNDLEPATKYEVCVSLKNQSPRPEQCIVFVTGSNTNELEQRERLIHIIVIVCAMVLAVPAGMFACTTNTRIGCLDRCTQICSRNREKREAKDSQEHGRQGTFDSLQAASDEGLYRDSGKERKWRRRSEDKVQKGNSAQLY